MRKTLSLILVLVVLVAFSTPSFAYPRPIEKLKDGATDVITSPLLVRDHMVAETKSASFAPFGLISGLFKGGVYMTKKVIDGSWKIATFPLDLK